MPFLDDLTGSWFRANYRKQVKPYDPTQDEALARKELSQLPVAVMLGYLRETHRYFLEKALPEMEQNVLHLLQHFSESHPHSVLLCNLFLCYKRHLSGHIQQEEERLFPYVDGLLRWQQFRSEGAVPSERSPELAGVLDLYSVQRFQQDHTDVGQELVQLRQLVQRMTPEAGQPFPFNLFRTQLGEFERALARHAWLEDEVLLPKVHSMECSLREMLAQMVTANQLAAARLQAS
ncbi:MAG: hypothetical protein AAGB22_01420 [Bacteroidota bacterium]